jgi:hypothetical protein
VLDQDQHTVGLQTLSSLPFPTLVAPSAVAFVTGWRDVDGPQNRTPLQARLDRSRAIATAVSLPWEMHKSLHPQPPPNYEKNNAAEGNPRFSVHEVCGAVLCRAP